MLRCTFIDLHFVVPVTGDGDRLLFKQTFCFGFWRQQLVPPFLRKYPFIVWNTPIFADQESDFRWPKYRINVSSYNFSRIGAFFHSSIWTTLAVLIFFNLSVTKHSSFCFESSLSSKLNRHWQKLGGRPPHSCAHWSQAFGEKKDNRSFRRYAFLDV